MISKVARDGLAKIAISRDVHLLHSIQKDSNKLPG